MTHSNLLERFATAAANVPDRHVRRNLAYLEVLADIPRRFDSFAENDDDSDADRGELLEHIQAHLEHMSTKQLSMMLEQFDRPDTIDSTGNAKPPQGNLADNMSTGEVKKIGDHFDKYSEVFSELGVKKSEFIGAFRAKRKLVPDLKADDFLAVTRRR